MRYELFYWPTIQGRGEFVRLALEEAGADYVDVARGPEGPDSGVTALMQILDSRSIERPPFAPPFLRAGDLLIAQTANILLFLGSRHGLAPSDDAGRLWTHQLQLTIADLMQEVHDTHHPIAGSLYYEDQRREAGRRAAEFLKSRAPKFLAYFEHVLERNSEAGHNLVGGSTTYCDLSLFQVVAGLRYAFPRAAARYERDYRRVFNLYERIAASPRIATYLASERRIPFNKEGIFRHYEELDLKR